jgi:hypothetical protein
LFISKVKLYDQNHPKKESTKFVCPLFKTQPPNQPNHSIIKTLISTIQKIVIKDVVIYVVAKVAATKSGTTIDQ